MQYSNIRSRAGLVALVFALIISLVSAVPIPATESGLSSNLSLHHTHDGHHHIKVNTTKISTPLDATRARTRKHDSTHLDMDDQLVRRSPGSKVKHAFQKAGNAIKHAAKKVGHFMKTTGAKVAKFGLKVAQSVGTAVSKAANAIPVIGKPLSRAIGTAAKVYGAVSDHIHANLGKKLQKGMKVMNKANKVMGYIPRRRELSEEEAFQQRDISDAYHFEERDDIALEDREESYFEAYERDIYEQDIYERYDLDEE